MTEGPAHYAVTEANSRGRKFPEKPHPYRSSFERDRDRIIHSEAFRRLEGKTQVFTPMYDDNYRNRLTHSIEVAQIGRTIARSLALNESLTEAICLAHDLGHSPFGHTGESVLNNLMSNFGGFEHNRQALRIVDLLEHPYPDFAGLNLMYETRLGLAKHKSTHDKPSIEDFEESNCSLEGQAGCLADRIAYDCHDLEDGMRSSVLTPNQLKNIELFSEAQKLINAPAIKDAGTVRIRTAKTIIDILVSDCIETSRKNLVERNIKTIDDVYSKSGDLIIISQRSESKLNELEEFLLQKFYKHPTVIEKSEEIRCFIERLFKKYCEKPALMPPYYQQLIKEEGLQRIVCDYIAGMTDRFCFRMLDKGA